MKRKIINSIKLQIKIALLFFQDIVKGTWFHLTNKKRTNHQFILQFEKKQQIMPSAFFENKCHNIALTVEKINCILLKKGDIFSFWHLIKNPNEKNGFKEGRTLRNGILHPEIGGGICQTASILYFTALEVGLEIIERHAHSRDIYQEHERYAPLGSDATVVYGNKDLRFRNPFDFDIVIGLKIEKNELFCSIFAQKPLKERKISFESHLENGNIMVKTVLNNHHILDKSYYLKNNF